MTQVSQVVYIYASPPVASLTVTVFAYNGSNYGQLTSSGSPKVYLYVNGVMAADVCVTV